MTPQVPGAGAVGPIRTWTFPPADGVPAPSGAYAHATAYGATLYVTGQLPVHPATGRLVAGDIVVQTDRVMTNLARVLELTGSSIGQVLMARTYLRAEADFPAYDQAFRAWFPDRLPSRTTVVVGGFAIADALIEIDLVAAWEPEGAG